MRKTVLVGILIFSLGLNIASFSMVALHWWFHEPDDLLTTSTESGGWHTWFHRQRYLLKSPEGAQLGRSDREKIKSLWAATDPGELGRLRSQAKEKLVVILGLLDQNPIDEKALEKATAELAALRGKKETESILRLRAVVSGLTEQKKHAFLGYLKARVVREQRKKSTRVIGMESSEHN